MDYKGEKGHAGYQIKRLASIDHAREDYKEEVTITLDNVCIVKS